MFYSEYSDYSPSQILDDTYILIAKKILELAHTDESKKKLKELLYEGGFEKFSVNLGNQDYIPKHKDSPMIEAERRLNYAYFFAQNPEAMNVIVENNILLYHGTQINALPNILKYGMNSVDELTQKGIDISTGEEWSRIAGKRNFISFTNSVDVAIKYAGNTGLNKNSEKTEFGITLGIAPEALEELMAVSVHSDIPEIGIINHVPLEYIQLLTVPKEKVDFIRKLVGDMHIKVVGADMDDPFYLMDMREKVEYLMNSKKAEYNKPREYTREDMRNVTKSTKLSKIIDLFKFNKNRSDRGKQYGTNSR